MGVLSRDDEAAIERAIAAAEARTSGELVVLVVPRSDDYASSRALVAGFGAVVMVTTVDWAWPWILQVLPELEGLLPLDPLAWLLPLQAAVAAVLWAVGGLVPARWLASDERRAEAVSRRAKQEFFDRRISHTRDRSGVLLFVSEQERSLVILADRGVDEALGARMWQGWAADVIEGMRKRRGGQALCDVIEKIGDALAERFGPPTHDVNELPNAVARGQ